MKRSSKTAGRFWLLLLLIGFTSIKAQISTMEIPYSIKHGLDYHEATSITFPLEEKMIDREAALEAFPMYAGTSIPVGVKFAEKASVTTLEDGSAMWRLRIEAPGAPLMGLVFSRFFIPENDKMFVFDDSGNHYIGAFTSKNNSHSGIFSTHILPVEALIIEYYSSRSPSQYAPDFLVDEIVYIFESTWPGDSEFGIKSSGWCNVNVNCPEGSMWQKQKRGVARILLRSGNSWFNCSGTLINNTLNDGTPYFLTSDHCGPNASSDDLQAWQFYFNYEYASCSSSGTAPQNNMLTGATIISRGPLNGGTDFKLLLLNHIPPLSWNPYYNGWTRSARRPESGTSIHHPSGDAKKISTYTEELTTATFPNGMNSGFWRVVWEATESGHGVTEGGSSGSPIFNHNGLVTGTLTGGGASCNSPHLPDFYGKFYRHWRSNGSTDDRKLSPWLDPGNDDPENLFGYDPNKTTNFVIVEINPPMSGMVSGAGYYAENENVNLVAHPNTGFTFINWTNDQGQVVSVNKEFQFVMPQSEILLTANFSDIHSNLFPESGEYKISVHPNPAVSQITIRFKASGENLTVKLYNISGQPVIEPVIIYPGDYPEKTIQTRGLARGIYFLIVETDNYTSSHKLIIDSAN